MNKTIDIDYIIQWQPLTILALNDWGVITNGCYGGILTFDNPKKARKFAKSLSREDKNSFYRVAKITNIVEEI